MLTVIIHFFCHCVKYNYVIKYAPHDNFRFTEVFYIKRLIDFVRPYVKTFFQRADIFLFFMCIGCSLFGTVMIYYAVSGMAAAGALDGPLKFVVVQLFSMVLGIGAFVLLTVIDADILGEQWKLLLALSGLLLVALAVFGVDDGTGNKAWIRFFGIGIQPSEFIKIFYIIVSAKQMTYLKERKDINAFTSLVQMAMLFGVVFVGIMGVSSDLGSCFVIMLIFLAMMFSAGVKLYWFAAGGAVVAAMVPLIWTYFLKDYQKKRLVAPYDPSVDPSGYGITWQTNQSRLTLASGRFLGVEEGHRSTVFTGKHTDFIFSAVGEELGMVGCILVLTLLVILIIHCAKVGIHAGRTFDMLICMGVAASLFFQMLINIGMCIGITPVIGITLPFFSYGGSSMMAMFAAMGLVSGVKFKPKPQLFSVMYN